MNSLNKQFPSLSPEPEEKETVQVESPEEISSVGPEAVGDLSTAKSPSLSSELHHAKAASALAYVFSIGLFLMFLANLVVVVWLAHPLKPAEALDAVGRLYGTWIPIFSGFVASAVTYYFTQNRR